jgi:hypothetical protein
MVRPSGLFYVRESPRLLDFLDNIEQGPRVWIGICSGYGLMVAF